MRLSRGYELATRTYAGYEGRNPITGAVVEVAPKTLPLVRKTTSGAVDLGLREVELRARAPVWLLPGVGFVVGREHGGERTLLPFAAFRTALNGIRPLRRFADDRAVRAAIAPSAVVPRLVSLRAGQPAPIDPDALAKALGGAVPPLALEAARALAACKVPPFAFERPIPREGFAGVAFASSSDFSWRLILERKRARVIETSTEPTEQLRLEAFLAQAAIVAAIAHAAGELSLSEDAATDAMRAMVAVHPGATQLLNLLPF